MFLRNWYILGGPSNLVGYNNGNACALGKNASSLRVYNGQTLSEILSSLTLDSYNGTTASTVPSISTNVNSVNIPWDTNWTFGRSYNSFAIHLLRPTLNFSANTSPGSYVIVLGEGIANDSTPVTLDDYDITNPLLHNDVIDSYTSTYDQMNGSISVTPVFNVDKTIREIGICKFAWYNTSQTSKQTDTYISDMESAGFTLTGIGDSDAYKCMLFLVYKTKLQTPIQVTAGQGKTITIQTDPCNMV